MRVFRIRHLPSCILIAIHHHIRGTTFCRGRSSFRTVVERSPMNCRQAARYLPGYLDGAISPQQHSLVREHLVACENCNVQLERFRRLAVCLATVAPAPPPADLAVRIRVRAAQSGAPWADVRRMWSRAAVTFENILKP